MCRYAMTTYKPHFACFECRKTFKRRLQIDIEGTTDFTIDAKCPQCGNLMANMGLDFESPKMSNLKSWKHIKDLYTVGVTFHSCGCMGPGYIPKDKEKLIKFLEEKKSDFVKNLRFWLSRNEPQSSQDLLREKNKNWTELSQIPTNLKSKKGEVSNTDAIEFWNSKISEIDNKLKHLAD